MEIVLCVTGSIAATETIKLARELMHWSLQQVRKLFWN